MRHSQRQTRLFRGLALVLDGAAGTGVVWQPPGDRTIYRLGGSAALWIRFTVPPTATEGPAGETTTEVSTGAWGLLVMLTTVVPAVTCTAQTTLLTGAQASGLTAASAAAFRASRIGSIYGLEGIGSAMFEHFIYDAECQPLTTSFADYLMATSTDFPNVEAYTAL